jgi:hypothetical protein
VVDHLADLVGPPVPADELGRRRIDDVGVARDAAADQTTEAVQQGRGPLAVGGRAVGLDARLQIRIEVEPVLADRPLDVGVVDHAPSRDPWRIVPRREAVRIRQDGRHDRHGHRGDRYG